MLALIIRPASIQQKSNGRRSQRYVNQRTIFCFLTLHIFRLPQEIPIRMHGPFDTLWIEDTQLRLHNHLQKTLGFMGSELVPFHLFVNLQRKRHELNPN